MYRKCQLERKRRTIYSKREKGVAASSKERPGHTFLIRCQVSLVVGVFFLALSICRRDWRNMKVVEPFFGIELPKHSTDASWLHLPTKTLALKRDRSGFFARYLLDFICHCFSLPYFVSTIPQSTALRLFLPRTPVCAFFPACRRRRSVPFLRPEMLVKTFSRR